MMVYHSYEKARGFDLNKIDYERGIFAIPAWWVGNYPPAWGTKDYSPFHPNEFGDTAVGLDIDTNVKTFTTGEQIDAITELFPDSPARQKIIDKYELGDFGRERSDWHRLDKAIGKFLRKKGYKLIHYTDDPMYGNVWCVLNRSVIKDVKFPPEGEK
jgi:hypothetical protein